MRYAVVDVESTGGKPGKERVIEVGIALMDDGVITNEFDSLVNPGVPIPTFVQNLTGITDKMAAAAPRFADIAQKVNSMLDGRVFVAHNVAFDYGFIREELRRAEISFESERICTVKLSRRVFPGMGSYSLHKLSDALGLPDFKHHRALGDALACAEILKLAEAKDPERVRAEIRGGARPAFLPRGWEEKDLERIPRMAGILRFLGRDGTLYLTSARNMRIRALALLASAKRGPLSSVHDGLRDIQFECTGSELLAKIRTAVELSCHRYPCNVSVCIPSDSGAPLPDMILFGAGRKDGEKSAILVRGGRVRGYRFVGEREPLSVSVFESTMERFPENFNLAPYLRPALFSNSYRAAFF